MRQRRADQMTTLDASNSELKAENNALQQQLSHLANHNRELMNENAMLKQDLLNMKQAMVRLGTLSLRPNFLSDCNLESNKDSLYTSMQIRMFQVVDMER